MHAVPYFPSLTRRGQNCGGVKKEQVYIQITKKCFSSAFCLLMIFFLKHKGEGTTEDDRT